nr:MAG TPA: helix-turn-helix domain protein [Caudoviricetes sp.]
MKNLSKATSFKVYMYMLGNVDNYRFALSTQDIADVCGMSKDTAKSAVNDLIEKGYLVLREKHSYDFYERPIDDSIPVEEEKKKFKVKGTVDEYIELTYQELINRVGSAEKAKILWDRH